MMMITKIYPFCGINTAIDDIEILEFFHSHCWIEFRKKGIHFKESDNI